MLLHNCIKEQQQCSTGSMPIIFEAGLPFQEPQVYISLHCEFPWVGLRSKGSFNWCYCTSLLLIFVHLLCKGMTMLSRQKAIVLNFLFTEMIQRWPKQAIGLKLIIFRLVTWSGRPVVFFLILSFLSIFTVLTFVFRSFRAIVLKFSHSCTAFLHSSCF